MLSFKVHVNMVDAGTQKKIQFESLNLYQSFMHCWVLDMVTWISPVDIIA